jgi:acetylornithine deacetylase/succinyl-diaminopimelate desuccinylase-like protein
MTDPLQWLEPRAEEMAELLQALLRIDTENPPGRNLGRCGRALRDALQQRGLEPELIEVPPQRELEEPCVIRASVGEGEHTLYFHGHFDVVPAQSRAQFEPRREHGRISGRGSADMKGGLVSMLYGALAARALGWLEDRRIVLHFVCDEETGSVAGSGYLQAQGLIDEGAAAMLTAEPTGGVVWHAARGAITLRVTSHGKEAHVGYADQGENAFERMIKTAEPLTRLAHELHQRGTMLVVGGQTQAGAGFNVVPAQAWFSLDRRFNPDEDLDTELERLKSAIEDADVEVLQAQPAGYTDPEHPAAAALAAAVNDVEGTTPSFELCPGVLDTRWYAQLGIPAFAYGGGRLDISHGPAEYIDERAMRNCAAVYARFAATYP